jgi:hypothetical protein
MDVRWLFVFQVTEKNKTHPGTLLLKPKQETSLKHTDINSLQEQPNQLTAQRRQKHNHKSYHRPPNITTKAQQQQKHASAIFTAPHAPKLLPLDAPSGIPARLCLHVTAWKQEPRK